MAKQVSLPAAILGLQGLLNIAIGIYGVTKPSEFFITKMAEQLGGSMPRPVIYATSLLVFSLGLFSLSAANQPGQVRQALIIRMLMHLVGGYLFWKEDARLSTVAYTDLGFAVLNAAGLAL